MLLPEIALITAAKMPKPDLDTGLLVDELARLGVRATIMTWDDPVDWKAVPLVVLRTPWDYVPRLSEFMEWTARLSAETRLLNPFPVVRWNSHKSYLLDLAAKHVPVVPTRLLWRAEGTSPTRPFDWTDAAEIVVKPASGVGANGAMRGKREDPSLLAHLHELLARGDALIQPFVSSVAHEGEVSLVYFNGVFSHAIRKLPAPGDFRVQDQHGGTLHPHEPSARELAVASAAMAAAPAAASYARVDLVEDQGGPMLMELELIEPELFLRCSTEGLRRFAQVLKESLGK